MSANLKSPPYGRSGGVKLPEMGLNSFNLLNEHYNVNKNRTGPGYYYFSFSYIHPLEIHTYVNCSRPGTNKGKRRKSY
jgi:hypothetical protein